MILRLKICWYKLHTEETIYIEKIDSNHTLITYFDELFVTKEAAKRKYSFNSYAVYFLVTVLKSSEIYRSSFLHHLFRLCQLDEDTSAALKLRIFLNLPEKPFIDYKWSDLIGTLCYEKRELDSAMGWLSTLGGAFSALGDNYERCAIMAGKISAQQFQIALRLGDPQTLSRCKLFFALSLIQRGYLKMARVIVRNEYDKAILNFPNDIRLKRMCCGIWSKLQYEWRRKNKK